MNALYEKFLKFNFNDYCNIILKQKFYSIEEKEELCNYHDYCWYKYKQYSYPTLNYIKEQKLIYENLLSSTDALTLAKAIKRHIPKSQVIPLESENIEFKIEEIYYDNIISKLLNLLNVYGYFINRKEGWSHPYTKKVYVLLVLEAKFNNIEYTDTLSGKHLYHITTKRRLPKILKYGLITKSHSKRAYHPSRIYFLLSNNADVVNTMSNELYTDTNEEPILLTIDLSKHPFPIKLYKDAESAIDGVYTLENISPDCIVRTEII